ncbi:hypothetical protein P0W64_15140 [Tsukamurella sp. 8F]|uniref:hypothetical protein n=1 Tax=unclassified Tsukamurella TaxID=2633480 RepID=UPI0023B935CA|nr:MULTISPECIES: hypothetical protein [unclassified Tsukamurella]MDF0532542.1 hypothetical protein [Tsukamurella sp. 8J]MDF0588112.1 hypothetical protein [Tsukamurella sp. 8F]
MRGELFLVGEKVMAEGPARVWNATVLGRHTDGAVRVRFEDGDIALLEPDALLARRRPHTEGALRGIDAVGDVVEMPRRTVLARLTRRRRAAGHSRGHRQAVSRSADRKRAHHG